MSEKPKEGWYRPPNSRKFHYYVDHRSLCGKWTVILFAGPLDPDTGSTGPLDCAACARKLAKRREKGE